MIPMALESFSEIQEVDMGLDGPSRTIIVTPAEEPAQAPEPVVEPEREAEPVPSREPSREPEKVPA